MADSSEFYEPRRVSTVWKVILYVLGSMVIALSLFEILGVFLDNMTYVWEEEPSRPRPSPQYANFAASISIITGVTHGIMIILSTALVDSTSVRTWTVAHWGFFAVLLFAFLMFFFVPFFVSSIIIGIDLFFVLIASSTFTALNTRKNMTRSCC